jgi:ATP-dependent NAD(P)H-hydrate dehydratase
LALQRCLPPLSSHSYKGSSGRIGILGGSPRYTGAPFYAAMASLKAGADLSFVFCAEEAAIPIKCYSPELMVAPVYCAKEFDQATRKIQTTMDTKGSLSPSVTQPPEEELVEKMVEEVTSMLDKLHALVVGPGLGRCPLVMKAVARILQEAQSTFHLPLVLDADALFLLTQPDYRHVLTNQSLVVLTPNAVERKRLEESDVVLPETCIIVEKGACDNIVPAVVSNSHWESLRCEEPGGLKRSGGIGDVLAGTMGTLVAWNRILTQQNKASADDLPLACWTACCFVKFATKRAFDKHRRSMTAPDVLHELGPAIDEMTKETVEE